MSIQILIQVYKYLGGRGLVQEIQDRAVPKRKPRSIIPYVNAYVYIYRKLQARYILTL